VTASGANRLQVMRAALVLLTAAVCVAGARADSAVVDFEVAGDSIPAPLTAAKSDAARGRAIVANRQVGLCLLCHSGPFPEERFQGNLAPSLAGAGARWSTGQLRLRLVDARRVNPQTIMPPYHRSDGLVGVNAASLGRPLLTAQQIEDVVAFLSTLKE
jgi:L-cysteine S-thiosulfotransferase